MAEIMGYVKTPRMSSISWGISMEPKSKVAFISEEAKKHKGFQLTECGLFVIETLPFLAASPDGIASCECCGKSVVEIKFPASLKGASLNNASMHLQYLNSDLQLKQDHAYYAQVQAQMATTKLRRAYFLVFTGASLTIELISFNESFWSLAEPKAASFFFTNVFPELQTKQILKQIECAKETCYCHGTKSGRIVQCILCTANFHLKCVQLKRTPKSWTCRECQVVRIPRQ